MSEQRKFCCAYVRTNGLRAMFDIMNDFDIVQLTAYRKSEDEVSVRGRVSGSGVVFGKRESRYMTIRHKDTMTPLNEFREEVFEKIDDLGLHDLVIEEMVIVSKKEIAGFDHTNKKSKLIIKLSSVSISDEILKDAYENFTDNAGLEQVSTKRGVLQVVMVQTEYQKNSIPAGRVDERYVVLLNPNWKDHEGTAKFPDPATAWKIVRLFGEDRAIGVWMRKSKKDTFEIGGRL